MTGTPRKILWSSNITEVRPGLIKTHGVDQREIIKDYSYEEAVFFLLKARRPTAPERNLLRAVLVSHLSHGITGQSTLAVMEAADCRSDFLHALIAGFSVGAGIFHQGGLKAAMQELKDLSRLGPDGLSQVISDRLGRGERIIGYGHRFHPRDPRVEALIQIARDQDHVGPHLQTAIRVEDILARTKMVRMNIEAACAGILLDLEFDPLIGHLFIVLGRSPMFAAAYLERLAQGHKPFPKIEVSDVVEGNSDDRSRED